MRLLQGGLALVAVYLLLVTLAWLFQRRLIYLPMDQRVPPVERVLAGAQEVVLRTRDGLSLGAWFLPARNPEPMAAVIFCNGNAGNRSYRAAFAAALGREGISVLLFDYRGYGGNPGMSTEEGLVEDLQSALGFVQFEKDFPADKIVLVGESLGAAVAVAAAVDTPPAGLVLRSPFLSMTAVGKLHYPFLPVALLLKDRYPNEGRVPKLRCPLLVLAGEEDRIVPAEQSRRLYEAAGSADKRFVLFRGADHNSDVFLDGPAMIQEIVTFVQRVVPQR